MHALDLFSLSYSCGSFVHCGGVFPLHITFVVVTLASTLRRLHVNMRSSAIRAISTTSRTCLHNVQVTSSVTGATSAIPAYIVPAEGQSSSQQYIEEEDPHEPEAARRRRSQEAEDGSARIGMVELPAELQLAVSRLIEGAFTKLLIRRPDA